MRRRLILLCNSTVAGGNLTNSTTPSEIHNNSDETFRSHWRPGQGGYEWKTRYLEENRERAVSFMFDVTKRDSLRRYAVSTPPTVLENLKSDLSEYDKDLDAQKLRGDEGGDAFYHLNQHMLRRASLEADLRGDPSSSDHSNDHDHGGGEELAEEWTGEDSLDHLTEEEINTLMEEFYPKSMHSSAEEHKLMQEVLRTRKAMSTKLSYRTIPQQERNLWSAWYLRHVV
eukprot:PhF_6_TR30145/c0_g1_i1/m.44119